MLATRVGKLPDGPGWEYEVKWDGYRIEAIKAGSRAALLSRREANYSARFEPITEALRHIDAESAILDGEVVAVDPEGRPSFQALQNRGKLPAGHQLVYYVFDLLSLNGKDLTRTSLSERRAHLPRILAGSGLILFSASLKGTPEALMKAFRRHNLEGIVAKRNDSIYEAGRRSLNWQKLPLKPRQEFVIGGYRPEAASLELLLVGYYDHQKFLFAGKVRQGLNPPIRRKLFTLLKPLAEAVCPFANLPNSRKGHWGEGVTAADMKDYVWLKPQLVAEIKFTEWTSGGVLRHAEFAGLRDDKAPREVTKEQIG